ncbi:MAG: DegT/DnrJ/EryC1/StrS family aminotransferase [Anaerolineales bacterium]|nr:DegT/DnrJ/EryC1/StrS family aminotransferase [Anaerolineales bacterium]
MQGIESNQAEKDNIPFIDLTRQYKKYKYEYKMAIDRVLNSGIYASGAEAKAFEKEFAEYYGSPHCISTSNGTQALEIGLAALGLGPGDGVVTVANAGMHSTTAIRAIGANPQFAEVDPILLTMSAEGLQEAITAETRAVVVTHLYGRVADIEALAVIVDHNNLLLVEDCFQANGASVNGKHVGTYGQLGSFCFAPAKTMGAMGKAGAIITPDADTAQKARRIRLNGDDLPRNAQLAWSRSRFMDEIQAAVLRVKLPMLEEMNLNRRMIAQTYAINFGELAEQLMCINQVNGSVFQHYVIRTQQRDQLRDHLLENGVGSTIHYPAPDYEYAAHSKDADQVRTLPDTEKACGEVLSLPCYPELTPWEIERVCTLIKQKLAGNYQ